MKKTSLLTKIILGLIVILAIAAVGWYSMVWFQSRVTGARPVYLQLPAPDAMTLRWGTEQAAVDTVFYGLSADNLDKQLSEDRATVNHRVRLLGLRAGTRYYYRIQHNGQWLHPETEWFITSPEPSSSLASSRIWVLGDPGKWLAKSEVHDAGMLWLKEHAQERSAYADVLLTTGDNAYPNATTAEYLHEFFMPYQDVLKNIPLWAVYGNHDARRWAFYKLFERPLHGESGGLASNSKHYFSFDYGQAHFIVLDNHHFDLSPETAMTDWLQRDIKQSRESQQKWVIVVFHHPPYTGGTYDSDNEKHSRGRMKKTRENLLPVLEKAGVDLVINGHSHVYERSHLIHCHYGLSDSFADNMILDAGTLNKQNNERVYRKATQFSAGYTGTMYMVLGSSGEGNKRGIDHPALPFTSDQAGSVVLDIDGPTLTSLYITANGRVEDRFRIVKMKNGTKTSKPVSKCD